METTIVNLGGLQSFAYSPGKELKQIVKMSTEKRGTFHPELDREKIQNVIRRYDIPAMRVVSRDYYSISIHYKRIIEYFSNILTYCWAVYPVMRQKQKKQKSIFDWMDTLDYMELINPELIGPTITRNCLLDGACYIAVKEKITKENPIFGIQYLPIKYCRSTKQYHGQQMVDFDVTFFDKEFKTELDKSRALEAFPSCVTEKYYHYKNLKNPIFEDRWQTLNPDYSYKFSLTPDDVPFFIAIVLDILDLQDIKDMTMFKFEQELSKLLIQRFPMKSDGEPAISLPELQKFHQDTAGMVQNIPGVDLITTYASVSVEDMMDSTTSSASKNPIQEVITNVYDSAGVSMKLFNADNAGTLSRAIVVDESFVYQILRQMNQFLQSRLDMNYRSPSVKYKVIMPTVSFFNRADQYKNYKSLSTSILLPLVILGQRQSSILAALNFERDYLELIVEPEEEESTSSTNTGTSTGKQGGNGTGDVGRPELPDDEKSDKTIQNRESL